METCPPGVFAWLHGQILARVNVRSAYGQAFSMAYRPGNGEVWLLPIRVHNAPRHRAEVKIAGIDALGQCGLPGGEWLVSTHLRSTDPGYRWVGSAPLGLLEDVTAALIRQAEALAYERKHRPVMAMPVAPSKLAGARITR